MKILNVLFVILIFSFCGCWKEDDDGFNYYEQSFEDNITSVIKYDSIYIIINPTENLYFQKDTIPQEIINSSDLEDTIRLNVTVKYGTSSKNFIPIKEVNVSEDSIFLSYIFSIRNSSSLLKTNSINQTQEPKPVYYKIEKINIFKSSNKQVWLFNNFYRSIKN